MSTEDADASWQVHGTRPNRWLEWSGGWSICPEIEVIEVSGIDVELERDDHRFGGGGGGG